MSDQRAVTLKSGQNSQILDTDVLVTGGVQLAGKLQVHRVQTAISYIALATDYYVGVTNTAAPRTITMPSPAVVGSGWQIIVKDESGGAAANHITIAPFGAETFDGAASVIIGANYGAVLLLTNGTNWFVEHLYPSKFVQSGVDRVAADTSTTSVAFVNLLTVTLNCEAGDYLLIRAHAHVSMDATNRYGYFRTVVDGVAGPGAGYRYNNIPSIGIALVERVQVLTTGPHTVNLQWRVNTVGWTVRCRPVTVPNAESAALVVEEVRS